MSIMSLLGTGAFLSGVSLFYLVMQRTRKQRMRDAGIDPNIGQF